MVRITPLTAPQVRSPGGKRRRSPVSSRLPTASDLFVESLPDSLRTTLFAGNLPSAAPSTNSDAHLYFLLAKNKHIPNRQRLVIWLNGGPGCSSFDGALIEIGPYKIDPDGSVREVEKGAWNEYANVLFLDQPAGTGMSYVTKNDNVRELADAADQVVKFLENLYQIFPEYATMDTYIAGESYAGQYIPYIAAAIQRSTTIATPLRGLLIGNGWISPREQYPAYLDYLVEKRLVRKGSPGYRNVLKAVDKCRKKLDELYTLPNAGKGTVLVNECEEILGVMSGATMKDGMCLNMYDTSQYHACGTEWPPDLPQVTRYLRDSKVISTLHAQDSPRPWSHCDNTVASHFWTPLSVPSIQLFPELLQTVPILLYAGDRDLMCAGIGIEKTIAELEWDGLKGFNDSEPLDWTVDGNPAGRWTVRGNLTYVEVTNSSHMVPMDQPLAAHDMLLRFMAVDTLGSAGPAAQIPSRVGASELDTILGSTRPNGSSLDPLSSSSSSSPFGAPDDRLDGAGDGSDAAAAAGPLVDSVTGEKVLEDGFDINHERYYGPRRTAALVVLLVVLGALGWVGLRWRRTQRVAKWRRRNAAGGRTGKARTRSGSGIRLEERERGEPGAGYSRTRSSEDRSPSRRDPREPVTVFDVGDDDDEEDDDGEGERESENEEAWGDLGRQGDQWGHDAGAESSRFFSSDAEKGLAR
ncbi:hypothetical protein JCM11491_004759 [Sporobolomyces phaffii]